MLIRYACVTSHQLRHFSLLSRYKLLKINQHLLLNHSTSISANSILHLSTMMKKPLLTENTDQIQEENNKCSWKKMTKYGLAIALFSTTTGCVLLATFLVVTADSGEVSKEFVLTPDAAYWQKIGIENANRDLDLFETIASNMSSGSTDNQQLDAQLKLYQKQVDEAAENNRLLIPKIMTVITKINDFLEGDSPSVFSKMGLRALIWYVDGKRDNKSYYLLDGAQLWCELRVKILQKFGNKPEITKLLGDLKKMQEQTAGLRDELDDFAQIFVKGIKDIHSMTCDISGNLAKLKEIAHHLLEISVNKDKFLVHTTELEKKADDLVKEYGK